MNKFLFIIFMFKIVYSNEICQLYFVENYDLKNNIYEQGLNNIVKMKKVYCNNPIIKKLQHNKLFIEKRTNKVQIQYGKLSNTIYYRVYFKYIKLNNNKYNQKVQKNYYNKKSKEHICEVYYKIKKSNPSYPKIFYKEKFTCKNKNDGLKYQKKLGCKKRIIWEKNIRYEMQICPLWVNLIK